MRIDITINDDDQPMDGPTLEEIESSGIIDHVPLEELVGLLLSADRVRSVLERAVKRRGK